MDDLVQFKVVFLGKYENIGNNSFYKYLLAYCMKKIVLVQEQEYKGIYPHIEMLKYYDNSLKLYRRDGDESLMEMAKVFRKVAHKIYRVMLRKNLIATDNKFLTEV